LQKEREYGENPYSRYILVTATSAAVAAIVVAASAAAVAKEEEHEAYSDDDPNVFAVKKVAQAVHKTSPFKEP